MARQRATRLEPQSRDLNRTREKILAAALTEFSAKGFAGARVDAIARRARVNKRMLYYCFGAKQDLYREILRRKIADRAGFIESTPDDFAGALAHIYLSGGTDIEFIRLMEWEAIESGGRKCIAEDERRARERENFLRWLGERLAGSAVSPVVPVRSRSRLNTTVRIGAAVHRGRSFNKPSQLQ